MRTAILSTGVLLVLTLAAPTAQAQSVYSEDWEWNLTPYYLWLPTMRGDAVVMGTPAPIDIRPGDVIEDLGFVFDFRLEGGQKANGFWVDATYLNLVPEEETPGGTVETDIDITLAEAFGFYRFTGPGARSAADLTYGVRYWHIEPEVTIPGNPKVSGDQDWVDGAVGLRLLTNLDNKEKWRAAAARASPGAPACCSSGASGAGFRYSSVTVPSTWTIPKVRDRHCSCST
jgi:hypothetical protein